MTHEPTAAPSLEPSGAGVGEAPDSLLATTSMGRSTLTQSFHHLIEFPQISLAEFKLLPRYVQEELITRNRIINTDTYNRTMSLLESRREDPVQEATFTLQLRRSPFNYHVVAGVEDLVEKLTAIRISQAELDFAREWYRETKVPFFNDTMWQKVIDEHSGRLPFVIRGVPDGSVILPGESFLSVTGPQELVAHFEPLFHRPYYDTLVAGRAAEVLKIVKDPARFIEVGKRGAITEEQHLRALKAARIGGGFKMTSNDAAGPLYGLTDVGTIGHRYLQSFPSVEAAFRHAVENLDFVVLLVDLVESYQGIDLALRLMQEYRESGKKIWIRLDSGDIKEQTRYFLTKAKALGLESPRFNVVVEGIDSLDELREIEEMVCAEFGDQGIRQTLYGAGGLLISEQTTRKDASSGFKITNCEFEEGDSLPTMKFSDSPGKGSYPGKPRLVVVNGRRVLAEEGEDFEGQDVEELTVPIYRMGAPSLPRRTEEEKHELSRLQYRLLFGDAPPSMKRMQELRAVPSPEMERMIEEVRGRYSL